MIRCLTALSVLLMTALMIATSSSMAMANEFVCRSGDVTRVISVEYEHKGWEVPCRVKYEKPDEGGLSYPWNAQATPGYCEDRAEFLADKLQNWGWVCTEKEARGTDTGDSDQASYNRPLSSSSFPFARYNLSRSLAPSTKRKVLTSR